VEACRRRLRETYETARALPMHNTLLLHNRDANFKPEFLLKRLGPTSDHEEWKQRVEWWCKSNRGDVRFGPRLSYGVHSNEGRSNLSFHHSFNNTAVIGEFMTPGTTHVAVGFTDLSSAAAAVLQWEELGEFAGAGRSGVLRWVGYEASPVSVAKALVVTSMMLGGEPEEAVMQVSGCLQPPTCISSCILHCDGHSCSCQAHRQARCLLCQTTPPPATHHAQRQVIVPSSMSLHWRWNHTAQIPACHPHVPSLCLLA
jgi:hypothetical protein